MTSEDRLIFLLVRATLARQVQNKAMRLRWEENLSLMVNAGWAGKGMGPVSEGAHDSG